MPDRPIYLWTPGDLRSDDEILRQRVHVADRWVIDTRRLTSWTDGFRFAVSLGTRHSDQPPAMLHDLAWAAISDWREFVAEQFDALLAREYLRGIS